mmetsp:Transcript_49023/g.97070  ORF Transcript_49023/g.97070 Transcript_49023/m.97070 type:complete len:295 (-) Transcript_49023:55-939(-)
MADRSPHASKGPTPPLGGKLARIRVSQHSALQDLRCLDLLRRWGELSAPAPHDDDWLALIWDGVMHDRTVPVPLDQCAKPLLPVVPSHGTSGLGVHAPLRKALEPGSQLVGVGGSKQVDEGVVQALQCVEIDRQVSEIVPAREALRVEEVQEKVPGEAVRQIAQHHCGARPVQAGRLGRRLARRRTATGDLVWRHLLLRHRLRGELSLLRLDWRSDLRVQVERLGIGHVRCGDIGVQGRRRADEVRQLYPLHRRLHLPRRDALVSWHRHWRMRWRAKLHIAAKRTMAQNTLWKT